MEIAALFDSGIYTWILLPLLIFCARICDVTLDTLRIIFVSKGNKRVASLLGFFGVLIWIVVMGQIMQNINNPACYIGYAGGFAMGNFIGISIEKKLAMGLLVIRIFTNAKADALVRSLKEAGFGVTVLDARGATGPVNVIYTMINRRLLPQAEKLIHDFNPHTFYSIEELRAVHEGIFPARNAHLAQDGAGFFRPGTSLWPGGEPGSRQVSGTEQPVRGVGP